MPTPLLQKSRDILQKSFGYDSFRPLQEQVLNSIYEGKDNLVIMPTGGGKSLCYQIPALVKDGVTFVISPLISLMKDQVDQLQELGIAATFLNSSLKTDELRERLIDIHSLEYKLVYIAPERLDSDHFKRLFAALGEMGKIDLVAVDEAHCISQWGHDFRPSYKNIVHLRSAYSFPFLALTATATERVKKDIIQQLQLKDFQSFIGDFDRKNLYYKSYEPSDKLTAMASLLRNKKDQSGIIYCGTRKHVEKVTDFLIHNKFKAGKYHAGLSDKTRKSVQEQFISDKIPIVVATNAFGMGIDKPNVRFVLHYDMPGSLEHYTQEAGRAGRDGEESECSLFFGGADISLQRFFMDGNNPPLELFQELIEKIKNESRSIRELSPRSLSSSSNGMAISTALNMLEGWGVINKNDYFENKTYEIAQNAPQIPFSELSNKREQSEAKLQDMLKYVETKDCKRNSIQKYFGFEKVSCEKCSSCVETKGANTHQEDVTHSAQTLLKGLASFPRPFGMSLTAAILSGSKSKNVMKWKADKWEAYNSLSGYSQSVLISLIKQLLKKGLIQRSTGEFPTISISEQGQKSIQENESIIIQTQDDLENSEDQNSSSDIDQELFNLLKEFRTIEAKVREIPPYMVFGDRTLREISSCFPQTLEQLQMMSGMGEKKIERYGENILSIILPHCKKHGKEFSIAQEKKPKKTSIKKKKNFAVGGTRLETFKYLEQKKSLSEIAKIRELSISTIESHVSDLISKGKITDITPFVDSERKTKILNAISEVKGIGLNPIKAITGEDVSYGQIKMVLAERKRMKES
jgi:ATP-dependent DNA helicase RecQ